VWFSADGYDRPWTGYVVDLEAPERTPVALWTAATTVTVDRLVTTRARIRSRDGTEIPAFVLHRRDVALDGKAPTVLSGYGGFRIGRYPSWSPVWALWADLGGVFVVACLRGGDEFGEAWHAAGCLASKQNVFDDFVAVADGLVEEGWVARERLAIFGGSNGGLLVAACANQRPDLCRAVVCAVPLTDMLRFHRYKFARIWTKEYGDPDLEAQWRWIRPYSPYHNVREGAAYPAALVTAGLEDGRVNAFHARKIAARWQAATSSARPVLLSIDRDSGHGSASRRQMKADVLDRFCFLAEQLAD
jgi:prolyl oligopeptidase